MIWATAGLGHASKACGWRRVGDAQKQGRGLSGLGEAKPSGGWGQLLVRQAGLPAQGSTCGADRSPSRSPQQEKTEDLKRRQWLLTRQKKVNKGKTSPKSSAETVLARNAHPGSQVHVGTMGDAGGRPITPPLTFKLATQAFPQVLVIQRSM